MSSIIILSSFLGVIYLLVIILVIILHRRNKEYRAEKYDGSFFGGIRWGFGCNVSSDPIESVLCCICAGIFFILYPFALLISYTYIDSMRRRADRDSEKLAKQEKERKQSEIIELETNLLQKRKDIDEKIEILKSSGYKIDKVNRAKIIELASLRPRISLFWMSENTKIPEEEIIIIIEDEPDFEIKDEYVINKKKILLEEEKKKIFGKICPICENPAESGSNSCLSCGYEFKK
jgi:hypothetical protein